MYAANIAIWVERTIFWIRQKDIQPIARMYNSTLPNIPYILARAPGILVIKLHLVVYRELDLKFALKQLIFLSDPFNISRNVFELRLRSGHVTGDSKLDNTIT